MDLQALRSILPPLAKYRVLEGLVYRNQYHVPHFHARDKKARCYGIELTEPKLAIGTFATATKNKILYILY
jgi:hypothetical protein